MYWDVCLSFCSAAVREYPYKSLRKGRRDFLNFTVQGIILRRGEVKTVRAGSFLHHFHNQEAEKDEYRIFLISLSPSMRCRMPDQGTLTPTMGESISINANKTAFHRPRRLDPRVILDSVKVTISTTCLLPEGWSFEIPVVIVLCIAMDFSSSLALSFKPGMLHMQNSLLPGSSRGFAEFFVELREKGKVIYLMVDEVKYLHTFAIHLSLTWQFGHDGGSLQPLGSRLAEPAWWASSTSSAV